MLTFEPQRSRHYNNITLKSFEGFLEGSFRRNEVSIGLALVSWGN